MNTADTLCDSSRSRPVTTLVRLIVAIVGIGVVAMACGNDAFSELRSELAQTGSQGAAGLKEYSKGGVTLMYPSAWSVSDARNGILFGVNTGRGTINVNVMTQPLNAATGTNLDAYTKANVDGISAMKTPQYSFEKVVRDEPITIHDVPARKITLESSTQDVPKEGAAAEPIRIRQHLVVAVKGGNGYLLTLTSPASLSENAEPVFQLIIDSWRF